MATGKTCDLLMEAQIPVKRVRKLYEGRPNILDHMTNGDIQLIINSPVGKDSIHDDSYLRKSAIKYRIPYITTMAAAKAAVEGISLAKKTADTDVRTVNECLRQIEAALRKAALHFSRCGSDCRSVPDLS